MYSVLVILIFCVFQILLLDKVYRATKIRQTKDLMHVVYQKLDHQNVTVFKDQTSGVVSHINELISNAETDVYLIKRIPLTTGEPTVSYELVYPNNVMYADFSMRVLNDTQLKELYDKINEIGKPKFVVFTEEERTEFNPVLSDNSNIIRNNTIIYCQKVSLADNQPYMIVLHARLTPVQPAIDTLKTQLLYITLIVVILSIIIAMFMSRVISKPITDINTAAKSLAKGEYNVTFNGEGYQEISELNDTLNYAVCELQKTETLQRELLANVSHDLRTPLTLITGYAEMIKDFPDENNTENIQIIIEEANRLRLLVSDLLVLSRISARTEPLNITNFDLTGEVLAIVNRQQKFVEHQEFKIQFQYDEHVWIEADRSKMEQVIYNFISNAINYSGDSKNIEVIQKVENGNVTIYIKDYGIGIKKEELECIWQRYYRVDKGHQRSTQGSGLGLSIIKGILDYHNFKYGVESKEGEGSTFWFQMPIVEEKE